MLAERLTEDEGFVSDLKTILQLEDDLFADLAKALREQRLFLDRNTLSTVVAGVLTDNDMSDTVSHFIWRLNEMLREADEPLDESLGILRKQIRLREAISEEDGEKAEKRIQALICEPTGFARQFKAEKLVEAIGAELEDVQIICDVRPVFNEQRSEIEGAIPISTLVLDVIEPNGGSSRIQVRLREADVIDLSKKIAFAKTKLAAIRRALRDKSIVIPFTAATLDERSAQ